MSMEALWSVNFSSNLGTHGGGVIVIDNGRVLGGDSGYTYVGSVRFEKESINCKIHVAKYMPGASSIFGLDNFDLDLVGGRYEETQFRLNGHIVGSTDKRIAIDLIRRAELP